MRRLLLLLVLMGTCRSAFAAPASIWWPGWSVSSSEELSLGQKYGRTDWTPAYPLSRMFDGNPATAWVYSGTGKEWSKWEFASRYGIELTPEHPVTIDGLRLMNGQNESRARFLRNDRVTQIRVTMDTGRSKITRVFKLAGGMGWHSVSLPRRKIKHLKIEFTGLRRGTGPQNDVCIAEMALLHQGKTIAMKMPRAVMFYDGLEGCNASYLITSNGAVLDGIAMSMGYEDEWSRSGRYVCGYGGDERKAYLWIADVQQGKVIRKIHLIGAFRE